MSKCENGVTWIYKIFGECVVTNTDHASFYIGLLSSVISLISSLPQIIQNFKNKTVEGQSPYFFVFLFTGSVSSLVGLLVNGGLVTQYIQAVIFVVLDGILVFQYFLYKCLYNICKLQNDSSSMDEEESKNTESNDSNQNEQYDQNDQNPELSASAFSLCSVAATINYMIPYSGKQLMGTIFGWISAIIYTSARLPQLYKNMKEKTVGDINPLYIIFSFFGNASYCLSIFIKSIEPQWCWNQTPWIIGAAGPCLCDVLLMVQMLLLGITSSNDDHNDDQIRNNSNDEEGTRNQLSEF